MPEENAVPLLVFFSSVSSGPARRMDSLLAHVARKERSSLRVVRVDVHERPDLVERFQIESAPALVLVKQGRVVARIEGRASAAKIELMLDEHLYNRSVPETASQELISHEALGRVAVRHSDER